MNNRRCNCRTFWCRIDEALHRLHIHWRVACDRHETQLTGGSE